MKKIIRLTESDLTRIVKRVITEQENADAANKVEKVIETPKIENKLEGIISNMSERDIEKLKRTLDELGIDKYSSAEEVHDKVKEVSGDEINSEMFEEEEYKNPKEKVAEILHAIGSGNISAWGGVPTAILIGGAIGSVATGFAISWGVTGLLMGLAKLLSDKD
jgi:hypothetical protein